MELLMILTYAAICVAVFKIFRIPVNKWTLPTAVLGGIFLIGVILLIMNYNHPFSANARIYFATTPIMPTVRGRVIEVPVKANAPLKQGDVLFKIDPRPYQYQVDQRVTETPILMLLAFFGLIIPRAIRHNAIALGLGVLPIRREG